jgi:hypothetical protein
MVRVRYVPAALLAVLLALPACSSGGANNNPVETAPPQASQSPDPSEDGTFVTPSEASNVGAEPGDLQVNAAKNDKGQYRLEPGQVITLKIDFHNSEAKPVDTKIIIEALCQNSRYDGTDSFTVPGSAGKSPAEATWTGRATIPADCEPLGIAGVADGSLNAEVRTVGGDLGYGRSSTVTFTVTE